MKTRSTLHLPVRPGAAPAPARELIFPLPQPRARRPQRAELGGDEATQASEVPADAAATASPGVRA